jgi:hypothetical protein
MSMMLCPPAAAISKARFAAAWPRTSAKSTESPKRSARSCPGSPRQVSKSRVPRRNSTISPSVAAAAHLDAINNRRLGDIHSRQQERSRAGPHGRRRRPATRRESA